MPPTKITTGIVVWSAEGVVLGTEPYDGHADAERDARVLAAIARLAERLQLTPAPMLRSRSYTDDAGNEWGRTTCLDAIQPGMVEVTPGRWGFASVGGR